MVFGLQFEARSQNKSLLLKHQFTTFANGSGRAAVLQGERWTVTYTKSNWGIESIAQQIEAATKGEREDQQSQPRSSLCKRPFLWLRPREIPLFSRLLLV